MSQVNIAQLPCNREIDYSDVVVEDRIIPFQYELDLTESNLIPGPGENQRFCYNITGVGQDTNLYEDLSHFVLGICDEITEDQLVDVTVL